MEYKRLGDCDVTKELKVVRSVYTEHNSVCSFTLIIYVYISNFNSKFNRKPRNWCTVILA